MAGFGEQLERERVKRGIKLEQISAQTKISTHMLRALETEEFEKLPGGVFNRAFVRSYARYLGIDEQKAVADFIAAAGEVELPLPVQQAEQPEEIRRWLPLGGLVILIVLMVVAIWQYSGAFANGWKHLMAKRPQPVHPFAASTPAKSNPIAPPTAAPASTVETAAVEKHSPLPLKPEPIRAVKSPAASTMTAAQTQTQTQTPAQTNDAKQLTITVRARQQAWLSITADGQLVMQGLLEPSSERQFHADRKLVFVTGNAGGVDLTFNGTPYGPLGAEKQRRQITFTSDGTQ